MTNTQKLGDDLYKKIENLLPGKTKRNQRIIGMFLDYPDRLTIEKSLEDDTLFKELVEGAIICIEKTKKTKKSILKMKKKVRCRRDLNPRGHSPMDFKSISLTTRTQQLIMYIDFNLHTSLYYSIILFLNTLIYI